EDFKVEDDTLEVYTRPGDLEDVRKKLEALGVRIESAEVSMVPKTTIQLDPKDAVATLRLLDRLEELDDVQRVYSNIEVSDEVLREYEGK
ncbi:MAG TPA: YebC/PmpR family DNA-binding transcriptional regulator, partial [Chloroflexota bacterium]